MHRAEDLKVLKEVVEILDRLEDCLNEMSDKEAEFIESMVSQFSTDQCITFKQHQYLLDINDRY